MWHGHNIGVCVGRSGSGIVSAHLCQLLSTATEPLCTDATHHVLKHVLMS